MRNKYQQDGVGLGPLHELVGLEFNWTLQTLKKYLCHSCRKEVVVSARVIFIITVMTFVTTTLTRLCKVS